MSLENIEMKKDEYGCALYIDTKDEHPDVISRLLNIQASEIVVKGSNWLSPMTKKVIEGKFNESNLWIFKMNKELSETGIYLNNSLARLLDIMDKSRDTFIEIFKMYSENHISCYAYFYDFNPYFKFDKQLLSRLAQYKIDIEFDIYFLPD